MKCERCKKREATVHLTEIKGEVRNEVHLCEPCASEKGLPGKAHFSISELLSGIAANTQTRKTHAGKEVQCTGCGMTLSQFQSSGRFGCPECYTAFKDDILPLVEKIHDCSQHVGRSPKRVPKDVALQAEIRNLQLELKRTIKKEDYELAAKLRDQIKTKEEELKAATPAPQDAGAAKGSRGGKSAKGKAKDKDKDEKGGAA